LFPALLNRVSDSLPGLGIVAAVLGIVVTSSTWTVRLKSLAIMWRRLWWDFLGLLLSYGMVAPIAANIENIALDEAKYLECMKLV